MKFNPFRPGGIVGPGMFCGRLDELRELATALFQIKNENPTNFLLHGERGIGKSSLMLYVKYLATGEASPIFDDGPHNFVVVEVELGPATTFIEIVRKIGADLNRTLKNRASVKAKAQDVWEFLKRWEVLGVRYHKDDEQPTELIEDLSDTFIKSLDNLGSDVDGALVLIDEADKPPATANLGQFVKLFTERLSKRGCHRVGIGLSGMTEVIEKLRESHQSSPRVLKEILLEPLLPQERCEVVLRGLREAEAHSNITVGIQPDALDWIAKYSEGFPHFIQQYAHSAFETDTDNMIDANDVHFGAYKENGALDQLGMTYFEQMYLDQIGSDEYRKVLQAMAEHNEEYMSRQDIGKITGLKETTLTHALRALRDRGIILAHREKKGMYKLPTTSFAVWIRARARRDKERQASKMLNTTTVTVTYNQP